MSEQSYTNHKRMDPLYHYVGFLLWVLISILSLVQVFRDPGLGSLLGVAVTCLLFIVFLLTRTYALKVQDRLIRLEETLRMQSLLEDALKTRMAELTPGQFVALRFASDAELPGLVRRTLDEKLDGNAIKKAIQVWRPDTFRV